MNAPYNRKKFVQKMKKKKKTIELHTIYITFHKRETIFLPFICFITIFYQFIERLIFY